MAYSHTLKAELARHRTAFLVIVTAVVLLFARARLAAGQWPQRAPDMGASCAWDDEGDDDWFWAW